LCNEQRKNRFNMALTIKPFNVIDRTELPEVTVDRVLVNGDPLEIDSQMYNLRFVQFHFLLIVVLQLQFNFGSTKPRI